MNNKDEAEMLMMILRALDGEKNVVENMEAEGQRYAVNNALLARKMRPSREAWEKFGFEFIDDYEDEVLIEAKLPEGWSIRATDHSMWNEIVDANGYVRGNMFYKSSFYDRDAHMDLCRRYGIHSDYVDEDYTTSEIYFGNRNEKIFVAGQVCIPRGLSAEERKAKSEEKDRLFDMAKEFADKYYPNWEDVNAYWDLDKNKTRELTQKD